MAHEMDQKESESWRGINESHAPHTKTMPIAIVGMSCRFAGGITSPDSLWERVSNGESMWSQMPQDRFHSNGFYHAEAKQTDSTHVKGGYFLDEDISFFDHSFFGFTAPIASAIDPQIRMMLELTYEALERAGITQSDVAGTKTSVYTGTFTKDYHDQLVSDPAHIPSALAVGNYTAMNANRISHFFDLKGTSMALDTGCSTSMLGLHLATQSLRSGESDCAIVGAAAINMNASSFMNVGNTGSLGPDGICYSFDHRAQGYGRGEGVAMVVLKRLDQALKDGNPIQAIVRETTTNQDGHTSNITSPDADAQYRLIRACYAQAGLDPLDTPVVEAHGTGTKVGDPIEASAIGRALRPDSKSEETHVSPIYMASLKTNIGHTEAVSGLASLIKMAKSLQEGKVAPSINFEQPNPNIDLSGLGIKIARTLEAWPANQPRRTSVNNFGYGGTNVHVILDAASSLSRHEHLTNGELTNGALMRESSNHGRAIIAASMQHFEDTEIPSSTTRSKLLLLWAREEDVLHAMCTRLHSYVQQKPQTCFDDLIYTYGQRRTKHPWSIAVAARSCADLQEILETEAIRPKRWLNHPARLAFVLNGQGAQHFAMGRELMHTYPVYLSRLKECDEAIQSLGAQWSILDELIRGEDDTKVNQVRYSMPMTCALQISLVALLADWNVKPTAVIGHSTGEIAAAYTSGGISLTEAMTASYYRGLVNADHIQDQILPTGGMLAVGLGPEQVKPYLKAKMPGRATVACYNSPKSVTLSGDLTAIDHIEAAIKADGGFARKLKVQAAFHSHHMEPLENRYEALLNQTTSSHGKRNFNDDTRFFSAVSGTSVSNADRLNPRLWVDNMLQPVRFSQAFDEMMREDTQIDFVVEVGPHSALAGPVRQILAQPEHQDREVGYGSCLERGKSAVDTMQNLAGMLIQLGCPLNVAHVNFPHHDKPVTLGDLPTYPWAHKTKLWMEHRQAYDRRFRPFPRHDLLGVQVPGLSSTTLVWKHVIRTSELPWVRDHVVQSRTIYPGAGFIAMAVEAVRQTHSLKGEIIRGYELQDVDIGKALVVPDDLDGVEVQIALEHADERFLAGSWRRFRISAADNNHGPWSQIATGLIHAQVARGSQTLTGPPRHQFRRSQDVKSPTHDGKQARHMRTKDLFDTLRSRGINHGPMFRNLHKEALLADSRAAITLDIADSAAVMPGGHQEPHVIHPTTLDSLFVAMYLSVHAARTAGTFEPMNGAVPRSIKRMYISANIETAPGTSLAARTLLRQSSHQGFTVSAVLDAAGADKSWPRIEIDDMFLQSIGHDDSALQSQPSDLCLTTEWIRSYSLNRPDGYIDVVRAHASPEECRHDQDLTRATYFVVSNALQQLTESDVAALEPHHRKYHEWMRRLVTAAESDGLGKGSAKWPNSSVGFRQKLIDTVASRAPNGKLAMRVGKKLLEILRKEIAPLELMLEDNLLHSYYHDSVRSVRSARQAASFVGAFAQDNPAVRILEIGGGTASYTQQILKTLGDENSLSSNFAKYTFTDISAGFFATAREQLAAWGNNIEYTTLDIESDPAEQRFDVGSYDIVVAGLVLHATKDLGTTLANVRSLLKENGKLVMIETTREPPEYSLIFGALPGWWLSEEPERRYSPNMALDRWDSYLKTAGFTGVDLSIPDCEQEEYRSVSSIVTTARSCSEPLLEPSATLVYVQHSPDQTWTKGLQSRFASELGVALGVQSLSAVKVHTAGIYILLFDEGSSSQDFDEPTFNLIKALVTTCSGLLCVTAGSAVEAESPDQAIHQGILRTARLEEPSRRYVSLDLNPRTERFSSENQDAIFKVFKHSMDGRNELDERLDQEFAVRDSEVLVPRIELDRDESRALLDHLQEREPETRSFLRSGGSDLCDLRLTVENPGLIDSIVFREDPEASQPLVGDFVEVATRAFGLNFKDVMGVMGMLNDPKPLIGLECAGVVTRIGPQCSDLDLKVGDRVACLLSQGHIANSVRTQATSVVRIPASMAFEQAAAVPVVFITAWYVLFDVGQCQPEDSVLIHAATGGVGQACVILAQHKGVKNIFVTAGTPEKRDFLRSEYNIPATHIFSSRDQSFARGIIDATEGRGVDIVINSLSGDLLAESLNVLAQHGRFVEIGKKDIVTNRSLDMDVFNRASSFTHVDVQLMGITRGPTIQRILNNVFQLLSKNQIRHVTPVKTYSLSEMSRAFHIMQSGKHMGKLVLVPTPEDLVKTISSPPRAKLDPNVSYLVVGGTTGIGRAIAQLLVNRGARHLLLISRNATSRKVVFDGSAKVVIKDCDSSDKTAMLELFRDYRSSGLPPIKGVVYCGMVLDDALFARMSYAQWTRALAPKLRGTRNIHESIGKDVDFFIMLSSLTGVVGYPSQSNYAAGNIYQDALARHRTARGLPAVTIDLGSVDSLGYLVDGHLDETADRVAKFQGRRAVTEAEVLGLVEEAIIRPLRTVRTCQIACGLSGAGTAAQRDPRCARLRQSVIQREVSGVTGAHSRSAVAAIPLSEQIASAESSQEAATFVIAALVAKVADMFALPQSEVNPAGALKDLGVDSLVAVELRNWLTSSARADISIFQLLDSPSLTDLAASVVALKRGKA